MPVARWSFLLITQPAGDALIGNGWPLDSDQQHQDCAALCRLSGRLGRTLPRALTVSVPLILDASAASCLQKRILSLMIPYFHIQK